MFLCLLGLPQQTRAQVHVGNSRCPFFPPLFLSSIRSFIILLYAFIYTIYIYYILHTHIYMYILANLYIVYCTSASNRFTGLLIYLSINYFRYIMYYVYILDIFAYYIFILLPDDLIRLNHRIADTWPRIFSRYN